MSKKTIQCNKRRRSARLNKPKEAKELDEFDDTNDVYDVENELNVKDEKIIQGLIREIKMARFNDELSRTVRMQVRQIQQLNEQIKQQAEQIKMLKGQN